MNHEAHMKEALTQAEEALAQGEFPVGCVIVHRDTVVARGRRHNASSQTVNEIDHAEIMALRQLPSGLTAKEKEQMVIYATMEPCLMCFSAIMLSGIRHIVYAYEDAMGGGTSLNRSGLAPLYRDLTMTITPGVCRKESLALFKRFFLSPENRYWKNSILESYTLAAR